MKTVYLAVLLAVLSISTAAVATPVRRGGVEADGRDLGVAGRRTFWRKAEFREGAYPKAKCGYAECAGMIYRNLFFGEDYQPVFRDCKMAENVRSRYPAKMLSALIEGMVRFAAIDAARRTDALKMARNAADILIGYSEKADAKYPHFPPTYSPDKYEANYEWPNRRKCMFATAAALMELETATR